MSNLIRYKKDYVVSDDGQIYKKVNFSQNPRDGYDLCYIDGKMASVHRIVYEAFVGEIEKTKEINHIDGNKHNNNIENLEMITHSENMKHAHKTGLIPKSPKGENAYSRKISASKELEIYQWYKLGKISMQNIGTMYGVSKMTVCCIVKKYSKIK
ncbi:HNH endonuclease signature motif containing protein [Sulfurimonas sp.]|uniref:HNH endonuclease signature motif containing protein n=1 Tax=Sulfurimonas sp. TaxID=2022749 RepID=UPI0025E5A97E|nr:HNH endonuclease signature motif containing protein [Sulfurimonas sp.]MCK9474070.1 HNH endonuclease [Sulfurimonas sp.]